MTAAPRVVLDTNVLVSALLFSAGGLSWLREAWQSDAIRPLASTATVTELVRVLAYPKFRLDHADRETLLADYLPWCEIVRPSDNLDIPACRDVHDRPFLLVARAAAADALVTGDADLLTLAGVFPIPIMTPAAFRTAVNPATP